MNQKLNRLGGGGEREKRSARCKSFINSFSFIKVEASRFNALFFFSSSSLLLFSFLSCRGPGIAVELARFDSLLFYSSAQKRYRKAGPVGLFKRE